MPICVISTTGTSVFSNASQVIKDEWTKIRTTKNADLASICNHARFEVGYGLYESALASLNAQAQANEASIPKLSAELNSLSHILMGERNKNDRLDFLATATPDGALAARIVADFCRTYFKVQNVNVHLVKGLQVVDGTMFQRDGVRLLIRTIYEVLKHSPAGTFKRVINPTGGFKGVVPYLTLIGMIEPDVQLSYIYEQSPTLINLGRIPLQFDFDVLDSARAALRFCKEEFADEAKLKELLEVAPDDSLANHPAWSLFDQTPDEGKIYFNANALGEIVLEHFSALDQTKIWLSSAAAADYDGRGADVKKRFGRFFSQLRDLNWLNSHRHAYNDDLPSGAICIKPGNYDERLWVYLEADGSVLVAELANHTPGGSYTKLPKGMKTYKNNRRLWEEA